MTKNLKSTLKDLLDRARAGVNDLLGLLNPSPRPALQPVPVRSPQRRVRRSQLSR